MDKIFNIVSYRFGVSPDMIISRRRNANVLIPRYICIFILINKMKPKYRLSFNEIGMMFNIKTHASVLNAETKIYDLLDTDRCFKNKMEIIYKDLKYSLPLPKRRKKREL